MFSDLNEIYIMQAYLSTLRHIIQLHPFQAERIQPARGAWQPTFRCSRPGMSVERTIRMSGSFRERYYNLLKAYYRDRHENLLDAATELGVEMLGTQSFPEHIVAVHEEALFGLAGELPDAAIEDIAAVARVPLARVFSAFDALYRDRLDAFAMAAERFGRVKTILGAVRDGIRLATLEKDREKLLQGTCDRLVQSKQYNRAWIAVLDADNRVSGMYHSGIGKERKQLIEEHLGPEGVRCVCRVVETGGTYTAECPVSDCPGCSLVGNDDTTSCLAEPVGTGQTMYGVIVVSLPARFVNDAEEQELLAELSTDIALALHNLDIDAERRKAEDRNMRTMRELARSNRELEQFASIISHDLREPLRMVGSYVELLSRRYKGALDEKADRYIYFAADGAKRMQVMINNLLAYSRVTTRGKPFDQTDCAAVVDEVIRDLGMVIEEKGVTVNRGALPTVPADRAQLAMMFRNLVSNAVKFNTNQSPRVEISARREGTEWIFSVADNGIGIDPRYYEKIFKIFQRLHVQDEYPGTGIGLAITRKIVERHNGRIWIESVPGKGSTFFFAIPAAQDKEKTDAGTG